MNSETSLPYSPDWDLNDGMPERLKEASLPALKELCRLLRSFLIEQLSALGGGHFASNLGVVELTVALHHLFDFSKDRLLWDTGHQAYVHKLLTGRAKSFPSLRKLGGLAPFPTPEESIYDPATAGHSGSALSVGLGLALSETKEAPEKQVVVVVGDGALSSGLTWEALNHLGGTKANLILILNVNGCSISRLPDSVIKNLLLPLFSKTGDSEAFEWGGLRTRMLSEGHQLERMISTLKEMKSTRGPQLLLLKTTKGKGHQPAEQDPVRFHGFPSSKSKPQKSYQSCFGDWAKTACRNDPKLRIISPAMVEGSNLKEAAEQFPQQILDVGIAEAHALTLSAGLKLAGLRPVPVIYSSFLQRGYDSLMHDLAIPKLPLLLAVDRAGMAGEDGKTHQGLYDLTFLKTIPGLSISAPSHEASFRALLDWNPDRFMAIRFPKRVILSKEDSIFQNFHEENLSDWVPNFPREIPCCRYAPKARQQAPQLLLINFGALLRPALEAAQALGADLLDLPWAHPLPWPLLSFLAPHYRFLVTLEEGVIEAGVGQSLQAGLAQRLKCTGNARPPLCLNLGVSEPFVGHGPQKELLQYCKLDAEGIREQIAQWRS